MDIRTGRTAEADTLADLWVALANEQRAYDSHLLADENRAAVREVILQRLVSDSLYVADDDGDLVGFVMFVVESGRYEQDCTRGVVENLFVQPAARDAGVGSALLSRAETALAEAGADVISLEAMADNEAARRFYRAHGYAIHRVEFEKPTESDTL